MKSRLLLLVCALPLFVACDRGPEIPANAEAPTPRQAARPAPGRQAPGTPSAPQGALPPGHPGGATGGGAGAAAPSGLPRVDPANPVLAGVAWTAPEGLTSRAPSNGMRAAEYVMAGEAGEAVLAISHFPGMRAGVDENVQRWVGQFSTADGQPVTDTRTERMSLGGLSAVTVDVSGNFSGMNNEAGTAQRLLGLIVEAPAGPVFFKLIGPAATVTAAQPAFNALVQSVHPAG